MPLTATSSPHPEPSPSPGEPDGAGINGDRRMVAVERAIAELRRGRAILVEDRDSAVLGMAVETAPAERLSALAGIAEERTAAGRPRLVLTARRVAALGLTPAAAGPLAVALPPGVGIGWPVRLGLGRLGETAAQRMVQSLSLTPAPAAAAALLDLAKLGRLVPAALMVPLGPGECATIGAALDGSDLLRVAAADVETHARRSAAALRRVAEAAVPLIDHATSQCAFCGQAVTIPPPYLEATAMRRETVAAAG